MRSALIALTLVLAGCSSGGKSPVAQAVLDRFMPGRKEQAAPAAPQPQITRAAVEASGQAMIRTRLVNESTRPILAGATQNGPYVTYMSRLGQSLTLRGSLITASRGLGYDLLSVTTTDADPAVRARPIAQWPAEVRRTYRFPGRGPGGVTRTVACTYAAGEPREIEIVEVVHRGIQMEERCAGDGVAFTNYHFADAQTGFVWRSIQWLGPEQGAIDLEIIEPFTGD